MTDRGPALDELTSERERPAAQRPTRAVWVRRGLAGALVVALAALLGPSLLSGGEKPTPPRPRPTDLPLVTAQPEPSDQPFSALHWTVRGDLAGDKGFAAAVLDVARSSDQTLERVMYAATLPDNSRIALVGAGDQEAIGLAFRGANVQALHVPAGASPSNGTLSYAGQISSPDALAGWAGRIRGGAVVAVLLGRPVPLDAQLSTAIHYRDDGSSSRTWRSVRGRDGSAIVDLGRATDRVLVARTTYDESLDPLLMDLDGARSISPRSRNSIAAKVRVAGLDIGSYRGPSPRELRRAVVDGMWALLDPRHANIRILWSGRPSAGTRGALLLVRRADGPTFQLFVYQLGVGETYPQGVRHVPWARADLLPWITQTGQPGTPMLLVNPSGAGTAVLKPPAGAQRRFRIGADGLASLGDDQAFASRELFGSQITVLSTTGRTVVTTDWPAAGDDPFVLEAP